MDANEKELRLEKGQFGEENGRSAESHASLREKNGKETTRSTRFRPFISVKFKVFQVSKRIVYVKG